MNETTTPAAEPERRGETRQGDCPRCGLVELKAFGTGNLYECTNCEMLLRRHDRTTAVTRTVFHR